jgi:hypothetical protein
MESIYAVDFHRKIVKGISGYTADRGYVTGDFPFIPELFMQNAAFIPKAIEETDRVGMMGEERYRHLYVSFFGGIIATYMWYYARDTLTSKGLYSMCRDFGSFKELDLLSYNLMAMSVDEGEYEIKELFYEIYSYVKWELDEAAKNCGKNEMEKLQNDLDRTFFQVGMWVSLNRLGVHAGDE